METKDLLLVEDKFFVLDNIPKQDSDLINFGSISHLKKFYGNRPTP